MDGLIGWQGLVPGWDNQPGPSPPVTPPLFIGLSSSLSLLRAGNATEVPDVRNGTNTTEEAGRSKLRLEVMGTGLIPAVGDPLLTAGTVPLSTYTGWLVDWLIG